ncbi:MAG: hypothetical protein JNJ85_12565 [Candidatus Kapabacteria bacterium]|nr:hypothetical protein [Candidatus Kapabacteria bacterium]
MKIVESILSQLQSGSGSEGINTRPQDEITLQDAKAASIEGGTKIKQDRLYEVLVGVTDVSNSDKLEGLEPKEAAEKKLNLIRLANVQDLEYQIFYHSAANEDNAPPFPTEDSISKAKIDFTQYSQDQSVGEPYAGSQWKLLALKKIELQVEQTQDYKQPIYEIKDVVGTASNYAPVNAKDSAFMYSQPRTDNEALNVGGKYKKRVFLVRFQPPSGNAGWYKLRFASKTNRILGVRGDANPKEISPEEKVNIGTVQLKVKDLLKVKKTLQEQLEGADVPSADDLAESKITADDFQTKADEAITKVKDQMQGDDPKSMDKIRRIELYTYIAKLLAPGASASFKQNRAAIEFNVHVVKPAVPPDLEPVILVDNPQTNTFDKLNKTEIPFQAGPFIQGKLPSVTVTPNIPVQVVDEGVTTTASAGGAGNTAQMRRYKLVMSQPVSAGEYEFTIRHTNKSNVAKEEKARLRVFESKLDNEEDIRSTVENTFFGQEIEILPVPSDQKKIPAGQYYINAQVGDQTQPQRGLQYRKEVPASAKNVSVDILWEDPQTKERVSLLKAPFTGTPKQRPPKVIVNDVKYNPIADPKDPTVTVQNIKITLPVGDVGGAKPTELKDVRAFVVKSNINISGYKVTCGSPKGGAGGVYELEIRLDGPPIRSRGKLEGEATIMISAKAANKNNGEVSSEGKAQINVPISY